MPNLKRLQHEFSIIDERFLNFCACHGIFTVEDFLIHDLYKLVAFAECETASVELKQGITQVLSIIDIEHRPWFNGEELLEDNLRNKHVLSTGCEGVDLLLHGGLREGHMVELVGASSSGKTQLCLMAASVIASQYIGSVMFIDTCNSFSPKRIAHITKIFNPSEQVKRNLKGVMGNIFCRSVFDIFTYFDVLHELKLVLSSEKQNGNGEAKLHLLVTDSFSSLITPILGGKGTEGHSLMVSAGFLLKHLADEHNLAVMVTNHMVCGESGVAKPALGETWKSIPHERLFLSRDPGSNICNISLLKHSCLFFSGYTEICPVHYP